MQLGLKDSSRNLHANCAIDFFCPHLRLCACVQIFDVIFLVKNFWNLNKASLVCARTTSSVSDDDQDNVDWDYWKFS